MAGKCWDHALLHAWPPAWEGEPLKLTHPTMRRKMIVEMDQKEGLIRLHNPKGAPPETWSSHLVC